MMMGWKMMVRTLMTLAAVGMVGSWYALHRYVDEELVVLDRVRAAAIDRQEQREAKGMDPVVERLLERATSIEFGDLGMEMERWAVIDDIHGFDTRWRGLDWRSKDGMIDDPVGDMREMKQRVDQLLAEHRRRHGGER